MTGDGEAVKTRAMNRPPLAAAAVALLSLAAVVHAAGDDDRYSVENDFPLRVEDAFPLEPGEAYLKLVTRYSHGPDGGDETLVQPEIALGILPHTDLHVALPYLIGPDDRTGSGVTNVNVQTLLLEQKQGDWWPSVAVEGDLLLPTGVGSEGLDTTLELVATQTLTWSPAYDAVHVNLFWTHNAGADAETERDDAYTAILGYSRRVAPDTVVLADVLWERTTSKDDAGQLAEIGVIQQFGEHVQLSAALGVGLGDDAPDFSATVGVILEK